MTTIPTTIATARPNASTYRRRRLIVVAALSALGLGAHGVLTGPGGVPASAAGAGTATLGPDQPRRIVAEPGDSLWSIAERFHGPAGLRHYLDALVVLNGGTAIAAGQLVRLP